MVPCGNLDSRARASANANGARLRGVRMRTGGGGGGGVASVRWRARRGCLLMVLLSLCGARLGLREVRGRAPTRACRCVWLPACQCQCSPPHPAVL